MQGIIRVGVRVIIGVGIRSRIRARSYLHRASIHRARARHTCIGLAYTGLGLGHTCTGLAYTGLGLGLGLGLGSFAGLGVYVKLGLFTGLHLRLGLEEYSFVYNNSSRMCSPNNVILTRNRNPCP